MAEGIHRHFWWLGQIGRLLRSRHPATWGEESKSVCSSFEEGEIATRQHHTDRQGRVEYVQSCCGEGVSGTTKTTNIPHSV